MRRNLVIAVLVLVIGLGLADRVFRHEKVWTVSLDQLFASPRSYDDKLIRIAGVYDHHAGLLCTHQPPQTIYHFRPPFCIALYDAIGHAADLHGRTAQVMGRFYFDLCRFEVWRDELEWHRDSEDGPLNGSAAIRRQTPRCFIDDKRLTRAEYDRLPAEEQAKQSRPPKKFFPDMELSVRMIEALD